MYMTTGIEILLSNIKDTLISVYPVLSVILIILAGITYGLAQMQPADHRGKWQTTAMGLFIGGVIIAAIGFAADSIFEKSKTLLSS